LRRFADSSRKVDPDLLLGLDAPDDAAVYRVNADLALVQSVDFFTPIVDDPYTWGAIAAANAFSDVYAMGGRPLLALNLVAWPMDLDMDLLSRLLEGGLDKASEAGVSIVGGHTIDDREPKYGMAVTGTVHPDRIVRSSSARAGMSLFLTKPLSMGIVSTAIKQEKAPADLIEQATAVMMTLNADAAAAMEEVGAIAATDVTGFGLAGHLQQLARLSGVAAELWVDRIPLLDGVIELAAKGLVPGGTRRNEEYYSKFVGFDSSVPEDLRTIVFDAQTSGGLLIAVDEDRAEELRRALVERSVPAATMIGRIVEGEPGSISVKSAR
jgi:selenide, water dikinase